MCVCFIKCSCTMIFFFFLYCNCFISILSKDSVIFVFFLLLPFHKKVHIYIYDLEKIKRKNRYSHSLLMMTFIPIQELIPILIPNPLSIRLCRQPFPTGERVTYTGKECLCQRCLHIPVVDSQSPTRSPTTAGPSEYPSWIYWCYRLAEKENKNIYAM